jgi:hypothetical protein
MTEIFEAKDGTHRAVLIFLGSDQDELTWPAQCMALEATSRSQDSGAVQSWKVHGVQFCVWPRLATSVRQVTRDQTRLSPTRSDTGRSWFLLSSGCDRSRYYRVAHGTALIPNETQLPCRALVACLVWPDLVTQRM